MIFAQKRVSKKLLQNNKSEEKNKKKKKKNAHRNSLFERFLFPLGRGGIRVSELNPPRQLDASSSSPYRRVRSEKIFAFNLMLKLKCNISHPSLHLYSVRYTLGENLTQTLSFTGA